MMVICLCAQMERQAINFIVQASACDLMKMAMERITQALDRLFPFDFKSKDKHRVPFSKTFLCSARPTPIRPVYLILQVHDELIFEVESSTRMPDVIQVIRHEMERHDQLHLFLPVKVQVGANWDGMMPVF